MSKKQYTKEKNMLWGLSPDATVGEILVKIFFTGEIRMILFWIALTIGFLIGYYQPFGF